MKNKKQKRTVQDLDRIVAENVMPNDNDCLGYVLRVNGQVIKLSNGRRIWNKAHHAKAAFRNEFQGMNGNALAYRRWLAELYAMNSEDPRYGALCNAEPGDEDFKEIMEEVLGDLDKQEEYYQSLWERGIVTVEPLITR